MKKIDIRNYTSSVAADKSILEIERILIGMGARNIAKEYDGFGNVTVISFSVPMADTNIPYKLPGKTEPIKKLFLQQYRRPTASQIKQAEDQAKRTAWKNVREWVDLQSVMIKLEQVEFMEVFMPYMYNMVQGKTVFELSKETGYKALLN